MSIYILIAVDDDCRVRECVPVSDLKTAQDLYAILREIWGGSKVCVASRCVDDIPDNLVRALGVSEAADA
jgi:hypothetical protein